MLVQISWRSFPAVMQIINWIRNSFVASKWNLIVVIYRCKKKGWFNIRSPLWNLPLKLALSSNNWNTIRDTCHAMSKVEGTLSLHPSILGRFFSSSVFLFVSQHFTHLIIFLHFPFPLSLYSLPLFLPCLCNDHICFISLIN